VTIQAQILDLLRQLQHRFGLGLLLITHDLGVVAEMADRVAVMYAGRIVEQASVRELFHDARHPYTRGLLASIPGGSERRLAAIPGSVPALGDMPHGCPFWPRCAFRFEPCDKAVPGVTVIESMSDSRYSIADASRADHTAGGSSDTGDRISGIGYRVSDIGHPVSDIGFRVSGIAPASHETRCYLYSKAVDPERLPEERS
jgi:peptide/nickel transport system ATP-binding protein